MDATAVVAAKGRTSRRRSVHSARSKLGRVGISRRKSSAVRIRATKAAGIGIAEERQQRRSGDHERNDQNHRHDLAGQFHEGHPTESQVRHEREAERGLEVLDKQADAGERRSGHKNCTVSSDPGEGHRAGNAKPGQGDPQAEQRPHELPFGPVLPHAEAPHADRRQAEVREALDGRDERDDRDIAPSVDNAQVPKEQGR